MLILIFQRTVLKLCVSNKKLVNYQATVKIYLKRLCLTDTSNIWIGKMKSLYMQISLDTTIFLPYLMKTIGNLWNLKTKLFGTNLAVTNHYRTSIPLVSSSEKLKCPKVLSALRYFIPNKNRNYEIYAHYLHTLFYRF